MSLEKVRLPHRLPANQECLMDFVCKWYPLQNRLELKYFLILKISLNLLFREHRHGLPSQFRMVGK